jgi:hypothetical protein
MTVIGDGYDHVVEVHSIETEVHFVGGEVETGKVPGRSTLVFHHC